MNKEYCNPQTIQDVIQIASFCAQKGYVPATSGNFSVRHDLSSIAITVSGKEKGNLTPNDVMLIDYQAKPIDNKLPSAESLLHSSLYSLNSEIQAIAHIHSPTSTVLSKFLFERDKRELILENLELLKALSGVKTHEHKEIIPIFENTQNIPHLVDQVEKYIDEKPKDQLFHGYLIAGHGLYTWGKDALEVIRHVEALNSLLDFYILEQQLKGVNHELIENIR